MEQLEQARSAQDAKMCLSVKRLQSDVASRELDDPLPTYPLQVSQSTLLRVRISLSPLPHSSSIVATLEQRLNDPNPNVTLTSYHTPRPPAPWNHRAHVTPFYLARELSAHRWMLGTRVSKRCRPCGKLLIKPDLIGAKTDFKRQHAALFYLPLISIGERMAPPLIGLRDILRTFS